MSIECKIKKKFALFCNYKCTKLNVNKKNYEFFMNFYKNPLTNSMKCDIIVVQTRGKPQANKLK